MYGSVGDIFPTPSIVTATSLTDLTISRDNNVAGNNVILQPVFRIPADLLSTTKIFIQLPAFTFYKSSTSKCSNSNDDTLSCSFVENSNPGDSRVLFKYVTEVQVDNLCSV